MARPLSPKIRVARAKPGGSNVGKYAGVKSFAGPSGGAPKDAALNQWPEAWGEAVAADVWEEPLDVVCDAPGRPELLHDADDALLKRVGVHARGGKVTRRRI
jgi:hypothetical protein